jgi:predicted AAA+ superfamily ATPase
MQQNLKQGIGWDQMLYINFEDERLINMEVSDLNLLLETFARIYGTERPILFLDELQNIYGWEKFVRRLADNKYRLYITGSNAHMLSAEIATTLGGRFIMKEVYPYSFTEYLEARQVPFDMAAQTATATRAILQHHFDEYLQYGGFPEGAHLRSKRDYLMSVYQKIYLGDIAARHRIENSFALRFLFKKLSESIMQPMSFTRLTNLITSTGSKISKATVINYMDYAKEAYLIFPIKNISSHLSERESNPKYYFGDNGLLNLFLTDGTAALLENLVAINLRNLYGDKLYYI